MNRTCAAVLLAAASVAGCGTKDAVSLSARVEGVTLKLEQAALGSQLSGGFRVEVSLGEYASRPATARFETFELLLSDGSALGPLTPEPPTGDVSLSPGESRRLDYSFVHRTLLEAATVTALCAGGARVAGVMLDGADGDKPTSFRGGFVVPSGC